MAERRRGLGRGLGALIPSGPLDGAERPVDVFFPADGRADLPVVDHVVSPAGVVDPLDSDRDHQPGLDGEPGPTRVSAPDDLPADDGALVPVPGVRYAEIPVGAIAPNPRQPRQVFVDEELDELANSIREVGVLQPIVVRPVESDGEVARYELVMGERRWRAAQAADLMTVPAIVRLTPDGDLLRDALLENLHRAQLNPLEEAAAYQQLLEDFGCTQTELASRVSRSRPQISNTIRLLHLPPVVQRRVAAGVLSAGHARAILALPDADAMERLAQRVVAESMSVRATEEAVALDEGLPRPAVRRRPPQRSAPLGDLASRLSDRLDTRVRISLGQRKGRIDIEFASVDDLHRILGVLAPGDPDLVTDPSRESSGIDDARSASRLEVSAAV